MNHCYFFLTFVFALAHLDRVVSVSRIQHRLYKPQIPLRTESYMLLGNSSGDLRPYHQADDHTFGEKTHVHIPSDRKNGDADLIRQVARKEAPAAAVRRVSPCPKRLTRLLGIQFRHITYSSDPGSVVWSVL